MSVPFRLGLRASLLAILLAACGARTGLLGPVPPDAAADAPGDLPAGDVPDVVDACAPVAPRCGAAEVCGNGLDDDCNGQVDEGCVCEPGAVQPCFGGPPGRRNVGACRDGTQRCLGTGLWGACGGGINPRPDVCNGVDDACDGCPDSAHCPIACPGPGDPRVPAGRPFVDYPLRGEDFYPGRAAGWRWRVQGGACDPVVTMASFTVRDDQTRDAVFHPTLSGDYTVTLVVELLDTSTLSCTFLVHVAGPGLRVELCWDHSATVDLDLYVRSQRGWGLPWWTHLGDAVPEPDACDWSNCEAVIRGQVPDAGLVPRADWGFANSALDACQAGPHGADWRALGYCANPRLDIDNNLSKATGTPENINVNRPREGDRYRVMVHNFSGPPTHPIVNIYCGGRLYGTYGAAPDLVPNLTSVTTGNFGRGAIWRAVNVTTHVNAAGATVGCDLAPVHPPGRATGYDVTVDDMRF